jgi:hypothetical protein
VSQPRGTSIALFWRYLSRYRDFTFFVFSGIWSCSRNRWPPAPLSSPWARTRRSELSSQMRHQVFQRCNRCLARHARILLQKLTQTLATFQIIRQRLERNQRPTEHRLAADGRLAGCGADRVGLNLRSPGPELWNYKLQVLYLVSLREQRTLFSLAQLYRSCTENGDHRREGTGHQGRHQRRI